MKRMLLAYIAVCGCCLVGVLAAYGWETLRDRGKPRCWRCKRPLPRPGMAACRPCLDALKAEAEERLRSAGVLPRRAAP